MNTAILDLIEIEAVTIIDVLRRAGAEVTVASVGNLQITASRGVKLVADALIADCVEQTFDLVVLPGGIPGAEHLKDDDHLKQILLRQRSQGRLYGAICAAPAVVLEPHGLLQGRAPPHATPAIPASCVTPPQRNPMSSLIRIASPAAAPEQRWHLP